MRDPDAPAGRWGLLLTPLLAFYTLVFVAGQVVFYRLAFHPFVSRARYDDSEWTLETLKSVFVDDYNRNLVVETLRFGLTVVLICILVGFPLAYVIARSRRFGTMLLGLVIVVSFTGVVVRAIGWRAILSGSGPMNRTLMSLGIVNEPLTFLNTMTAAVIGTAHAVLPYMVLLLTPSIESIDRSLEEAGSSLGASPWYTFRRVVLPLSTPGVLAGSLLVFATSMGTFTTVALLGGNRTPVLAIAIRQQLMTALNYPDAAAFALVLVVLVLSIVAVVVWRFGSAVSR